MRSALILCTVLMASAAGASDTLSVQLIEAPAPPEKTAAAREHRPPAKLTPAQREAIRAAARETEAQEDYIRAVIHNAFVAEYQERTVVPPEKDDYRRYLQELARKDEARNDPEVAEIRARFRDDEPRDDFRKWKQSVAAAQNKPSEPQEDAGQASAAADEDKKANLLIRTALKEFLKPHAPEQTAPQHEESKK